MTSASVKPRNSANLFRLQKTRDDRQLHAVCRLMPHVFGWELRVEIDRDLRSAVCRSTEEVLTTMEEWKAAMVVKGWAP